MTANCEFKGSGCEGHRTLSQELPSSSGCAQKLLGGRPGLGAVGEALLLCEPRGFRVFPLLAAASPSFSSFLLEKFL